eukprot:gene8530-9403_t
MKKSPKKVIGSSDHLFATISPSASASPFDVVLEDPFSFSFSPKASPSPQEGRAGSGYGSFPFDGVVGGSASAAWRHGEVVWAQVEAEAAHWPALVFDPLLLPRDLLPLPPSFGKRPAQRKVPVFLYGREDFDLAPPAGLKPFADHLQALAAQAVDPEAQALFAKALEQASADALLPLEERYPLRFASTATLPPPPPPAAPPAAAPSPSLVVPVVLEEVEVKAIQEEEEEVVVMEEVCLDSPLPPACTTTAEVRQSSAAEVPTQLSVETDWPEEEVVVPLPLAEEKEVEVPQQEVEVPQNEVEVPLEEIELNQKEVEVYQNEVEVPQEEVEAPLEEKVPLEVPREEVEVRQEEEEESLKQEDVTVEGLPPPPQQSEALVVQEKEEEEVLPPPLQPQQQQQEEVLQEVSLSRSSSSSSIATPSLSTSSSAKVVPRVSLFNAAPLDLPPTPQAQPSSSSSSVFFFDGPPPPATTTTTVIEAVRSSDARDLFPPASSSPLPPASVSACASAGDLFASLPIETASPLAPPPAASTLFDAPPAAATITTPPPPAPPSSVSDRFGGRVAAASDLFESATSSATSPASTIASASDLFASSVPAAAVSTTAPIQLGGGAGGGGGASRKIKGRAQLVVGLSPFETASSSSSSCTPSAADLFRSTSAPSTSSGVATTAGPFDCFASPAVASTGSASLDVADVFATAPPARRTQPSAHNKRVSAADFFVSAPPPPAPTSAAGSSSAGDGFGSVSGELFPPAPPGVVLAPRTASAGVPALSIPLPTAGGGVSSAAISGSSSPAASASASATMNKQRGRSVAGHTLPPRIPAGAVGLPTPHGFVTLPSQPVGDSSSPGPPMPFGVSPPSPGPSANSVTAMHPSGGAMQQRLQHYLATGDKDTSPPTAATSATSAGPPRPHAQPVPLPAPTSSLPVEGSGGSAMQAGRRYVRVAAAICCFGMGGRVVVAGPSSSSSSFSHPFFPGPAATSSSLAERSVLRLGQRCGPLRCYRLLDLLQHSQEEEEMKSYLELAQMRGVHRDQEEANRAIQRLSAMAANSYGADSSEALLAQTLLLLLRHRGQLSGGSEDLSVEQQLARLLLGINKQLPNSLGSGRGEVDGREVEVEVEVVKARLRSSSSLDDSSSSTTTSTLLPLDSEYYRTFEAYALLGLREEAIDHAVRYHDWPNAMVLAQQAGLERLQEVVRQYATVSLRGRPGLHLLSMLATQQARTTISYAGNNAFLDPSNAIVQPGSSSSSSSSGGGSEKKGGQQGVGKNAFLSDWRHHLALIVTNKSADWRDLVVTLAKRLDKEAKDCSASHLALLAAGHLPGLATFPLPGLSRDEARKKASLGQSTTLAALRRCEVVECALLAAMHAANSTPSSSSSSGVKKAISGIFSWSSSTSHGGPSGSSSSGSASATTTAALKEVLQGVRQGLAPFRVRLAAILLLDLGLADEARCYLEEVREVVAAMQTAQQSTGPPAAPAPAPPLPSGPAGAVPTTKGVLGPAWLASLVQELLDRLVVSTSSGVRAAGSSLYGGGSGAGGMTTSASTANSSSGVTSSLWGLAGSMMTSLVDGPDVVTTPAASTSGKHQPPFPAGPSPAPPAHHPSYPPMPPQPAAMLPPHSSSSSSHAPTTSSAAPPRPFYVPTPLPTPTAYINNSSASGSGEIGLVEVDLGAPPPPPPFPSAYPSYPHTQAPQVQQQQHYPAGQAGGVPVEKTLSRSTSWFIGTPPESVSAVATPPPATATATATSSAPSLTPLPPVAALATAPTVPPSQPPPAPAPPAPPAAAASSNNAATAGGGAGGGSGSGLVSSVRKGLLSWLYPEAHDASENIGSSLEAFYDKQLGRWVFPGEEASAAASPALAPPPMAMPSSSSSSSAPSSASGAVQPPSGPPSGPPVGSSGSGSASAAENDPLAALMAPPPRRLASSSASSTSLSASMGPPPITPSAAGPPPPTAFKVWTPGAAPAVMPTPSTDDYLGAAPAPPTTY